MGKVRFNRNNMIVIRQLKNKESRSLRKKYVLRFAIKKDSVASEAEKSSPIIGSKVFIYNEKELNLLVDQVEQLKKNKQVRNHELIKRKMMNRVLGISETDLIELARRV